MFLNVQILMSKGATIFSIVCAIPSLHKQWGIAHDAPCKPQHFNVGYWQITSEIEAKIAVYQSNRCLLMHSDIINCKC